jgi:hypothetical protein
MPKKHVWTFGAWFFRQISAYGLSPGATMWHSGFVRPCAQTALEHVNGYSTCNSVGNGACWEQPITIFRNIVPLTSLDAIDESRQPLTLPKSTCIPRPPPRPHTRSQILADACDRIAVRCKSGPVCRTSDVDADIARCKVSG